MRFVHAIFAVALLAVPARAAEPVRVMVIGTVHLSNPNGDRLNVAVDDVLSDKRQAELAALNDALARFAPTKVAVEWPAALVDERYAKFLAGTLEPSRNEVVQISFRLARTLGLKAVYGVDIEGDFPFEAVDAFATAHDQAHLIEDATAVLADLVAESQKTIDEGTIADLLRLLNRPERMAADNAFYRTLLRVGGGDDQPGALLLAAWQKRNLLICARLLQLSQPGDRIVVLFGAGHGHLLRQCISETPGFELVEPNDYLPQ